MDPFKITLLPGRTEDGNLYVTVEYKTKEDGKMCLSITGVEGPMSNGNCKGSAGQCIGALDRIKAYSAGWDAEKAAKLKGIWKKWHLNDMKAGCIHQDEWDVGEVLKVPEFGSGPNYRKFDEDLLSGNVKDWEDYQEKVAIKKLQQEVLLSSGTFSHSMGKIEAMKYFPRLEAAGLIVIKGFKHERAGWVYPKDHEKGLLTKKCEVCGSVYGGPWQYRDVPQEVLETLKSFPVSNRPHPWGRNA
jgi:hypothetical protein